MRKYLLLISAVYCLLSTVSYADLATIDRLDHMRDRGYDYLDIYTSGWTTGRGLLLENKLYIDFPETRLAKNLTVKHKPSKRVLNIQATQKNARTARVIITLKREIDYDLVNVFGRGKAVVEIGDRADGATAKQFAWESANARKRASPLKPRKFTPAPSPPAEKVSQPRSLQGRTVILDPGHGGDDPGASSCDGQPEKKLTLATAQETAELLRAAGATVYLTRDEDRRSNLSDVVEFANRSRADIFLSIHYNSTYNRGIAGTESYYYNPGSRQFAEKMHEALVRGLDRKDRGLHRVKFYTVNHTRMPAVLLEPAYLSNGDESSLANSAAFRSKVAASIMKGVKNYFGSNTD
ncbi:MAG: N-acetylmuramoyl-L-alanine amidase [Candidatus Margulisiibacteriota bacterium]